MTTPNSKEYLRDVISLVNSLWLLCHMYSFVPLLFMFNSSPNIERSERLMEQKEIATLTISSSVTNLRINIGLGNSLCLHCLQSTRVPLQTTKIICIDFFWKSVYKWCRFVKTTHKCQNGGGFKMSKWCRYVKILQVIFVKMVQVQNNFGRSRLARIMYHLFILQMLLWLLSVPIVQSSKARMC